ncbi:hypothetical protein A6D98_13815 [Aliivibrio fischeri]|uniref:hypothetical protein n=2 Tax=Aliivibrio fischeri TaxID=668 RepID=UPI00080E6C7C|nr:hypothetical protein [Aliivibrio fischeri]OCH06265.1 hypothetical protein A6E10_09370 [Aliivibrio fischeri]OCH24649.1 hypothetical protein A6E12_16650 [Aliivibrio fischeri]OCH59445.1 hypothetical protein A6D98_13815 [Aliivibrio fischeri]
MYNLNVSEILMVDGGGDGNRPSSSRNPNNGHTTYGGQGNGFVSGGQHGGKISANAVAGWAGCTAVGFGVGVATGNPALGTLAGAVCAGVANSNGY